MYYGNNNNNNYNGTGRYNQYGGTPYGQQPIYQQPINVNDLPIDEIRFMTAAEADAYIVMPNHKALLIDMSSGIAKVKAASNTGQSSTKLFRFEEAVENVPVQDANLYLTRAEGNDFVKKTDFEELKNKDFVTRQDFNELLRKIENLQNSPPKAPKKVGESV